MKAQYAAEHEEREPSQAAFMGQATKTAYPEQPSSPPTVASAARGATLAADITTERPTETGKSDQGHLVAKDGEGKEQPQGGMKEQRGLYEQPPAIQPVRPQTPHVSHETDDQLIKPCSSVANAPSAASAACADCHKRARRTD